MEAPVTLAVAFALGFVARQVNLPPLVGFLAAGFALSAFGIETTNALSTIADLGVTLLLFSIGLKLKITTLLKPEVWAGASLHVGLTVLIFGFGLAALAATGAYLLADLDLLSCFLVAFALSFSSTVFAVKSLDEKGESQSLHGRVAIGILIMQDVFAVVFITASTGKVPSIWALTLIALLVVRPLLYLVMNRCGHGELIPLFGLFAALVLGATAFEAVGLKADLGALVLGILLANHPRAGEISDSLFGLKEIFLVGFFLEIGLAGGLTLESVLIAALLILILPIKVALYFAILCRFRLRARSASLAAVSLATYSEFGLIVGAIGVQNGWLDGNWLAVIAVALSATFILGAPLNALSHGLYARFSDHLQRWQSETRHPEDQPLNTGEAAIAIFGMGRIGSGAYDSLGERFGQRLIGVDIDQAKADAHREAGRNVIVGDGTDSDFWERLRPGKLRLVLLAMPEHSANLYVARQLVANNYDGLITAVARYPDEVEHLKEEGVHYAYDALTEAGSGFAGHVAKEYEEHMLDLLRQASKGD